MIKLVVGLGNIGREYELNRHNIGWLVIDNYKQAQDATWKEKFKGEFCSISHRGEKVLFLKPHTLMNLSGESVHPIMNFYKINTSEVLVIHDELDLDFGKVQFKKGGGLAGHNGLKSIAQHLGNQDFLRMRVGIGRPSRGSVSSWVLSDFPVSQNQELETVLTSSSQALDFCLSNGIQKAANQFNKRDFLALG